MMVKRQPVSRQSQGHRCQFRRRARLSGEGFLRRTYGMRHADSVKGFPASTASTPCALRRFAAARSQSRCFRLDVPGWKQIRPFPAASSTSAGLAPARAHSWQLSTLLPSWPGFLQFDGSSFGHGVEIRIGFRCNGRVYILLPLF